MKTDPIADMLTIIRNGKRIYSKNVTLPHSKIKERIADKLKQEGFIENYEVIEVSPQDHLKIFLKYGPDGEQVIRIIKRASKPSRRVYKKVTDIKKVLGGLGISIFSTPKGLLTDRECREQKVGGEELCIVW